MRPIGPPPRNLADQVFRYLLQYGEHLRSLLQLVIPDLAESFDYERAALDYPEFFGEDWRGRESDLPFLIPYRLTDGSEGTAIVLVLVEHQSEADPRMPLRMLHAIASYWDRQWRQWERQPAPRAPLRLRPVLPVVFHTGLTPWTANRRLSDLLAEPAAFHRFAPGWEPVFWSMAEQSVASLLQGRDAWLQFLAIVRSEADSAAVFESICAQAFSGIEQLHERDRVRWQDLVRAAVTWIENRRPIEELERLRDLLTATIADAPRSQEVNIMWKSMAETHRDEGRVEGRVEGELWSCRKLLRKLIEKQFGAVPDPLAHQIDAITEVERLEAAILRVPESSELEDLQL